MGARISPLQPATASQGESCQAPSRVMNSPTKLLSPGRPSAAMVTTRKRPASTGIAGATPVRTARSREPGMEGPQWDLDGERDREQEEEPELDRGGGRLRRQGRQVEGVRAREHVLADHPDQHQQRSDQRVEDELERGVAGPVTLAPQPEQEVGGDQHGLPEDVEEEQVE